MFTIENDVLKVTARTQGGELRSIREKADDTEYLWNGDPSWWKYSSPVLFPNIGVLNGGKLTVDGQDYEMPAHGLGRISEFEVVEQQADYINFQLKWSDESLKKYPYKFILQIGYKLDGRKIHVQWKVFNDGDVVLPFSIGAHPAFMCPIVKGEKLEDCYLEFNKEENTENYVLEPGCMLSHKKQPCLKGTTQPLSDAWFKDGVMVFDNLQSDTITIKSNKSEKKLSVSAPGFTHWGIWSNEKGGCPFVCLEPWYGHADYADYVGEFADREGSVKLEPGQKFETEYIIEI